MTMTAIPLKQPTAAPAVQSATPVPSSAPRRLWRWGLVLAVLIGTVWKLPRILATPPLRDTVMDKLGIHLPPGTTIGNVTLDWNAPIRLEQIEIPDQENRSLLKIDRVESERTLWQFLSDRSTLGRFVVQHPSLHVVVEADGTNVQAVLSQISAEKKEPRVDSQPRKPIIPLTIEVREGEIEITDHVGQSLARFAAVQSEYRVSSETSTARLQGQANAVSVEPAGKIGWESEWGVGQSAVPGKITVQLERVPLDGLHPYVARFLDRSRFRGEVGGKWSLEWTAVDPESEHPQLLVESTGDFPQLDLAVDGAAPDDKGVRWSPRGLQSHWKGVWDLTQDVLTISQCQLKSELLELSLRGRVEQMAGDRYCHLVGKLDCDLTDLLEFIGRESAKTVVLEGLRLEEIAFDGPLNPDAAETGKPPAENVLQESRSKARLSLKKAEAYSLIAEDVVLDATWRKGKLALSPLSGQVGGGKLVSLPTLDFHTSPVTAEFSKGVVLERVAFNEALTHSWLRLISPFMADTAKLEGTFSLETEGGRVPLGNATTGRLAGNLLVHSAQIGPGPLAERTVGMAAQIQELATLRPAAWYREHSGLTIQDQEIAFELRDGRVYHQDLHLEAGDFVIESKGSVGLDNSLDLALAFPLPDKWFQGGPIIASLKGESLRIGVTGNLKQPEIDGKPLAEFGKRMGARAAGGLLEKLLSRPRRR